MDNINVNRIYKLKIIKDYNPLYVYCLYAPSVVNNTSNQKCVGIVLSEPKQANDIYSIISNPAHNHANVIYKLNIKYELVTFWSVDAVSEFKDIFFKTRKIQEINNNFSLTDNPLKHYSQVRLDSSIYKHAINSFNNYNVSSKPKNEINPIDKITDSLPQNWKYKDFQFKLYNHIFIAKINDVYCYVYSPIFLFHPSNKTSGITYIGIILTLGNNILKKRKSNVIQSILESKNPKKRNELFKVLDNYLSMDKNALSKCNRIFKFNSTLFKDHNSIKENRIHEKSINSYDVIAPFSHNIIDIFDFLPVYRQYKIIKPTSNADITTERKIIYNSISIPNYFDATSPLHNNCYIKYKSGEIGFVVPNGNNNIYLKFKIPSIDRGFKIINVYNMITVDVTKWYSVNEVEIYGRTDDKIAILIKKQIEFLSSPLKKKSYFLDYFFRRVSELKKYPKVQYLYDRISSCCPFDDAKKVDEYDKIIRSLCNYIDNPNLLNNTVLSIQKPTVSDIPISISKNNSISILNNYNYKDYKGTNGIFYTLSNEVEVINSNTSLENIQAKFIRKFAYVPKSDELKKIFSLLVVDINLITSKIIIECYNNQKKNYMFNIEVSTYKFSFKTIPKDNALYFARIIAVVCNKIFSNYEHNPSNTYTSSSKNALSKSAKRDEIAIINYSVDKRNSYVTATQNSHNTTSSKDIHFRRGHWHYYWYGHRNSPDRFKELKWVNETIVNRNADSIIIQL